MKTHKRYSKIVDSGAPITNRVCICIPMTGLLRSEWVLARYGQTIPVNWSNGEFIQWIDTFSPLSYNVADARNISVDFFIRERFEWLLFIDHDVVLPPDTFIKMNEYIALEKFPVVSGLYRAKGNPPEPLVFRGLGNSWYRNWKPGDKVMVDGIPMGCALISRKLLEPMYWASEPYECKGMKVRRVFHTPRESSLNTDTGKFGMFGGTEDLWWCNRVIKEGWLAKAGYKALAKQKYPFLIDTSIDCKHIDNNGRMV